MKSGIVKRVVIFTTVVVFLAAWGGVFAAKIFSDSVALLTAAVTAAAFATEGLIWVLAIVGGLAIFASRARLWRKVRGE